MDDIRVSAAELRQLLDVIQAWRDTFQPSCSESVLQMDSVNEALPELATGIYSIVGWWKDID